jgi:hypothetical protein
MSKKKLITSTVGRDLKLRAKPGQECIAFPSKRCARFGCLFWKEGKCSLPEVMADEELRRHHLAVVRAVSKRMEDEEGKG